MTEVYIVKGYTPYEGSRIFGVFSSFIAAAEVAEKLRNGNFRQYDYYEVDNYSIDEEC
jgi:hypothetical protein